MRLSQLDQIREDRSSVVSCVLYDEVARHLYLTYRSNGAVWCYRAVEPATYKALMEASSMGSFVAKTIKKNYDAEAIDSHEWESLLARFSLRSQAEVDAAYRRENADLFDALKRSGRSIGF